MKNMALLTMLCAGSALFATGCTESVGTTSGVTMSGSGTSMPAGLTSEEQLIWNSLSDEAKRDAIDYMEAGGSFRDFVAV